MSTIPPDWGAEHDARAALYADLIDETLFILRAETRAAGIKTHTLIGRVKDRVGFVEKISRKGYKDPFAEMPDIAGVRVVCLFMQDLPRLRTLISANFHVVEEEDKIQAAPTDSFGYMSIHYVCHLRRDFVGPRYDRLQGLRVEIQVRTLLMDAWANVSHYLAYKGEASIPTELRRGFHALSGLFYVADERFQALFEQSERSDREAAAAVTSGDAMPTPRGLNRASMRALLRTRYRDRQHAAADDISDLVEQVAEAGYTTIDEIVAALDQVPAELYAEYENHHGPWMLDSGDRPGRFLDTGVVRTALAIVDPSFEVVAYSGGSPEFEEFRARLRGSA